MTARRAPRDRGLVCQHDTGGAPAGLDAPRDLLDPSHRSPPFGGWEERGHSGVKLATAEKALFDIAYLSPARSRLFRHLPELTLPVTFAPSVLDDWIERVPVARSRGNGGSSCPGRYGEMADQWSVVPDSKSSIRSDSMRMRPRIAVPDWSSPTEPWLSQTARWVPPCRERATAG